MPKTTKIKSIEQSHLFCQMMEICVIQKIIINCYTFTSFTAPKFSLVENFGTNNVIACNNVTKSHNNVINVIALSSLFVVKKKKERKKNTSRYMK